jgi:hypothetical protein
MNAPVMIEERNFPGVTYKGVPLYHILKNILQDATIVLSQEDRKYSVHYNADTKEKGTKDYLEAILEKDKLAFLFKREFFNRYERGYESNESSYKVERHHGRRDFFGFYNIVEDLRSKSWLKKTVTKLFPKKRFFLDGACIAIKYVFSGQYETSGCEWSKWRVSSMGVIDNSVSRFGSKSSSYEGFESSCGEYESNKLNEEHIKKIGLDKVLDRYLST